jgi:hydroxymethylpyrimidine/phosphomethylpyrimidine kinase
MTLMTIAGFDPSSGAGITADLAVFAAHSLFGTACITALTVQSTTGVRAVHPVSSAILAESLACLVEDMPPAGIKIGMLASAGNVATVADFLEGLAARVPVVLDPVLRSSSGRELLSAAGLQLMKDRLLPLATWITPNLAELAALAETPVATREQMLAGCDRLRERYPQLGIVATGGHLDPPDDLVFAPNEPPVWLPGARIESRSTHGTGCAFSSSLLCGLVRGLAPLDAARAAKVYVAKAIRTAEPLGGGIGPMNLC